MARQRLERELANLNTRLAQYIESVQGQDQKRQRVVQILEVEEEVGKAVTNIKGIYESELAQTQRLLDDAKRDRDQLEAERDKYKAEAEEWKKKYLKIEKDLKVIEKELLMSKSHVNDLQARLNDAVNQRKHWENEYNKVHAELTRLEDELANVRALLDQETVARKDLKNRLRSLQKELDRVQRIHEEELNETRVRLETTIGDEVDFPGQINIDVKLEEMREFFVRNLQITRDEAKAFVDGKLRELRKLADQKDGEVAYVREELRTANSKIAELSGRISELEGQVSRYRARVRELEDELRREQKQHANDVEVRDLEIRKLREALEKALQEGFADYGELLNIKAIEAEVAAYRLLLEAEEDRLNISDTSKTSPARRQKATPQSRKRKHEVVEYQTTGAGAVSKYRQTSASSGYATSSSAKGRVEIHETDPEGKFIKLYNTSNKDQIMGGWQLVHLAGDEETIYKFHRSLNLKAGRFCTVWGSDSETTHSPPDDLVMKGKRWFTGDDMKSTLINNKGEEVAVREMTRSVTRVTRTVEASGSESGFEDEQQQEEGDRSECFIM